MPGLIISRLTGSCKRVTRMHCWISGVKTGYWMIDRLLLIIFTSASYDGDRFIFDGSFIKFLSGIGSMLKIEFTDFFFRKVPAGRFPGSVVFIYRNCSDLIKKIANIVRSLTLVVLYARQSLKLRLAFALA
jgi:hypothetical protein